MSLLLGFPGRTQTHSRVLIELTCANKPKPKSGSWGILCQEWCILVEGGDPG